MDALVSFKTFYPIATHIKESRLRLVVPFVLERDYHAYWDFINKHVLVKNEWVKISTCTIFFIVYLFIKKKKEYVIRAIFDKLVKLFL